MKVRVMAQERWPWLTERAGLNPGPGFGAVEAVREDGSIAGAYAMDGWTPGSVSLHVAIESPIALRKLVRHAFAMAFHQFNRGVVTVTVLSSNARSLALVKRLGFHHVFTGRDYWAPGTDLTVWEMRKEECKYLACARNPGPTVGENTKQEAA